MIHKGFSLIELLIVVAIIGILAAIALPNFLNAQVRAKVSRSLSDFRSLSTAFETYHLDYNNYPPILNLIPGFFGSTPSHAFIPLTTPVAYYSGPVDDPFQPDHHKKEPLFDLYDGSYAYSAPVPSDADRENGRFIIESYSLMSFGPDQLPTVFNTSRFPDFYHPSNGIISGGDIIYNNRQQLHNYGF